MRRRGSEEVVVDVDVMRHMMGMRFINEDTTVFKAEDRPLFQLRAIGKVEENC